MRLHFDAFGNIEREYPVSNGGAADGTGWRTPANDRMPRDEAPTIVVADEFANWMYRVFAELNPGHEVTFTYPHNRPGRFHPDSVVFVDDAADIDGMDFDRAKTMYMFEVGDARIAECVRVK